jgi:hypothetical protein
MGTVTHPTYSGEMEVREMGLQMAELECVFAKAVAKEGPELSGRLGMFLSGSVPWRSSHSLLKASGNGKGIFQPKMLSLD